MVSVIMPVYNGGNYLYSAIESILKQTFRDFELIIVNDGSTDNSADIIRTYTDPRIRFYEQENQGLIATLNRLISLSQGTYLARMDQDDISLPDRLQLQVDVLDQQPGIGLVGSWVQVLDQDGEYLGTVRYPVTETFIRATLSYRNSFAHGAIMMRRSLNPSYDPDFLHGEDYELWCRLALSTGVTNIPRNLYQWRFHPTSISATSKNTQLNTSRKIKGRHSLKLLSRTEDVAINTAKEKQYRGNWAIFKTVMTLLLRFPSTAMTHDLLRQTLMRAG